MVATFPLGVAYIGDVVEPRDRGAAIGVYTAAMGSGFAVGPLLGSWVAAYAGFPQAYLVGAVVAVAGAVFGVFRLVRTAPQRSAGSAARRFVDMPALRALAREPRMVMACVANMAMTLSMTGAIFTYFPVYARGVGVSTVTIGAMFAWRSLASATGRIPVGALSSRIPAGWTLAAVLLVEAAVDVAIVHTTSDVALGALLILEGVIFGIFLVSGQAAVAAASGATNRGAAVGMFWMAGSVGDFLGPLALGVVAQVLGLIVVFESVAAGVAVGAVLVALLALLAASRAKNSGQDGAVDVAAGDDAHHAAVASEPLQAGRH
jgi:MFS family permease